MTKRFAFARDHLSIVLLSLTLVIFCIMAGGGCGGSSHHNKRSNGAANRPETVFDISDAALLLTMDIDDNGMPDFLDFEGVAQHHIHNAAVGSLGRIYELSSLSAASEKNVTVPSMIWLNRLRLAASEDANYFSVQLTAGKEYTFEFSKNLTEDLGGALPSIKLYDPANAQLPALEAQAMNGVTIAAYPQERPSVLCYTIKPAVSGTYLVEISDGEPIVAEGAEKTATDSVLFIYEEFRNEDGDTGYYTNFKFKDADGNKTDSIGVDRLIYLRQLFLNANPDYFDEVYGQNLPDDMTGLGANSNFVINGGADYVRAMYIMEAALGFQTIDDNNIIDEDEGGGDDYELEPILDLNPSYDGKKISIAGSSAQGKAAVSAVDDMWSRIDTHIDGIPFEYRYETPGSGFLAISNFTPKGGVEVDISDEYNKAMNKYLKATDDYMPVATESYAQFVSTNMQAESLLKASNTMGLSTAAVGISLGSGSSNNLKFGLTSTNLVIHYEKVEDGYRKLKRAKLEDAWDEAGLFSFVKTLPSGDAFLPAFRDQLGDYYVAGYQYGACYDAYISIRTETSDQIKTLERKLSAELNLGDGDDKLNVNASFDKSLRETFKECNATFTVKIVTNGMNKGKPRNANGKKMEEPFDILAAEGIASNDVKALERIGSSLADFIASVNADSDPANFAPIRVKLTRWRQNLQMASLMMEMGDKEGTIPVTVGQAKTIKTFNSRLKNLTGYRNVVADNPAIDGDATAKIEEEYQGIIATVQAAGERFYASKSDVDKYLAQIDELSPKFKALADRYTFYRKLVLAQQKEKAHYDAMKREADALGRGDGNNYKYVREMPFGVGGGDSGYDEFPNSAYVTEDINAGGEELHKQYYIQREGLSAYRFEWHADHQPGQEDYLASAGAATLTAKAANGDRAVFCKVKVRSTARNSETDRIRELTNGSPAVMTSSVGFEFMSGRGDDVNWNIYGKPMRMRREDYPFNN